MRDLDLLGDLRRLPFRLHLPPSAARDLCDALYALDEHIAAGELVPEFDAEKNANLGELLEAAEALLRWQRPYCVEARSRERRNRDSSPNARGLGTGTSADDGSNRRVRPVRLSAADLWRTLIQPRFSGTRRKLSALSGHSDRPLDEFGMLLMTEVRDRVAGPSWLALLRKRDGFSPLLNGLAESDLQRVVAEVVDECLARTLFMLEEHGDRLTLLVDGADVEAASDGLSGELFGRRGWISRFSEVSTSTTDS